MDKALFDRELMYESTMNLFRSLLVSGLMSEDEYRLIEERMMEKYQPLLATLRSKNA